MIHWTELSNHNTPLWGPTLGNIMRTYVIAGRPTPLSRPRFSSFNSRVYDPQKAAKVVPIISLASQHNDEPLLDGPLHLDIIFYMPIPLKGNRSNKYKINGTPHCIKPDLDNLIKWIGDISCGVIYRDDALIASITSKKVYDLNPRTEFVITTIG